MEPISTRYLGVLAPSDDGARCALRPGLGGSRRRGCTPLASASRQLVVAAHRLVRWWAWGVPQSGGASGKFGSQHSACSSHACTAEFIYNF